MEPLPHPGVRFPPPLLFVVGGLAGWALGRAWPVPLVVSPADRLLAVVGLVLVVAGVVLGVWAVLTFRRARTAIVPSRPATGVVEAGPYRFSRNPMYVALSVAYLGVTLVLNSVWPLALLPVVLGALFVLVVRREERYLASAFGEGYAAYRRRVRRWL